MSRVVFCLCLCVLPAVCCAPPAVCHTPPSGSPPASSWLERHCQTCAELQDTNTSAQTDTREETVLRFKSKLKSLLMDLNAGASSITKLKRERCLHAALFCLTVVLS